MGENANEDVGSKLAGVLVQSSLGKPLLWCRGNSVSATVSGLNRLSIPKLSQLIAGMQQFANSRSGSSMLRVKGVAVSMASGGGVVVAVLSAGGSKELLCDAKVLAATLLHSLLRKHGQVLRKLVEEDAAEREAMLEGFTAQTVHQSQNNVHDDDEANTVDELAAFQERVVEPMLARRGVGRHLRYLQGGGRGPEGGVMTVISPTQAMVLLPTHDEGRFEAACCGVGGGSCPAGLTSSEWRAVQQLAQHLQRTQGVDEAVLCIPHTCMRHSGPLCGHCQQPLCTVAALSHVQAAGCLAVAVFTARLASAAAGLPYHSHSFPTLSAVDMAAAGGGGGAQVPSAVRVWLSHEGILPATAASSLAAVVQAVLLPSPPPAKPHRPARPTRPARAAGQGRPGVRYKSKDGRVFKPSPPSQRREAATAGNGSGSSSAGHVHAGLADGSMQLDDSRADDDAIPMRREAEVLASPAAPSGAADGRYVRPGVRRHLQRLEEANQSLSTSGQVLDIVSSPPASVAGRGAGEAATPASWLPTPVKQDLTRPPVATPIRSRYGAGEEGVEYSPAVLQGKAGRPTAAQLAARKAISATPAPQSVSTPAPARPAAAASASKAEHAHGGGAMPSGGLPPLRARKGQHHHQPQHLYTPIKSGLPLPGSGGRGGDAAALAWGTPASSISKASSLATPSTLVLAVPVTPARTPSQPHVTPAAVSLTRPQLV